MGDPICPFSNDDLAAHQPPKMSDGVGSAMSTSHDKFRDFAEPSTQMLEERLQHLPVDRRRRRRVMISAPLRVRSINVTSGAPDEISTTIDVSRGGLLFVTSRPTYCRGLEVMVTFPYSKAPMAIHAEQRGRVARVFEMPDGRRAVALALVATGAGDELVDAGGRKLNGQPNGMGSGQNDPKPPLVVAMDSDPCLRETLKTHLMSEGYEVIAVNNPIDAREVLNAFTPALVIAEIEGDDLPGYALCAHIKGTPRLQRVPVVLTTSSAYPSDYSSAHSLGAIVCMAKPYKQERLSHIVRLLAPLEAAKLNSAPARPADPTRRPGARSSRRNEERPGPGFWPFRLGK